MGIPGVQIQWKTMLHDMAHGELLIVKIEEYLPQAVIFAGEVKDSAVSSLNRQTECYGKNIQTFGAQGKEYKL